MSPPERAVVWLWLGRGGRRAVEVGIDPAEVERALAKWQRLLGSARRLEVSLYPARPDAGPPNPVFGLPDLHGDPVGTLAEHLVDQHGIGGDTTSWLPTTRAWSAMGARFGHQFSHQFSHHLMRWRPPLGRSCRWGRLLAGRAGRRLASLFRLPAPLPLPGAAPAGGTMPPAGRLLQSRRSVPAHPCHERWWPT